MSPPCCPHPTPPPSGGEVPEAIKWPKGGSRREKGHREGEETRCLVSLSFKVRAKVALALKGNLFWVLPLPKTNESEHL